MKKATRIVALLLLSVMCVGLLVACAPNSDPAKAEANADGGDGK